MVRWSISFSGNRAFSALVCALQEHHAHLLSVSSPHAKSLHFTVLPDAADVVHLLKNSLCSASHRHKTNTGSNHRTDKPKVPLQRRNEVRSIFEWVRRMSRQFYNLLKAMWGMVGFFSYMMSQIPHWQKTFSLPLETYLQRRVWWLATCWPAGQTAGSDWGVQIGSSSPGSSSSALHGHSCASDLPHCSPLSGDSRGLQH